MAITTSSFSAPKAPAPDGPQPPVIPSDAAGPGTAHPVTDNGLTTTVSTEDSSILGSPPSPQFVGTQKPFSTPVADVLK